jgi:hypothetical protein
VLRCGSVMKRRNARNRLRPWIATVAAYWTRCVSEKTRLIEFGRFAAGPLKPIRVRKSPSPSEGRGLEYPCAEALRKPPQSRASALRAPPSRVHFFGQTRPAQRTPRPRAIIGAWITQQTMHPRALASLSMFSDPRSKRAAFGEMLVYELRGRELLPRRQLLANAAMAASRVAAYPWFAARAAAEQSSRKI